MKRLWLFILILFSSLLPVLPNQAEAQSVDNFLIQSFTANYFLRRDVNKTAEMTVVEEIKAVFPNYDQNHGILRAIPKEYNGRSLRLKIDSVTDKQGNAYPFSESSQNDNLVLKIGDADTFVRGQTTYVISYTMRDVITFYNDYDEWFWDVNGTQWRQQFGSVTARIHMPNDLAKEISKAPRCFTGTERSTSSNCEIVQSVEGEQTIINVRAANLQPGENLSFLVGFTDNTFVPYQPTVAERVAPFVFWSPVLLIPILTGVWMYRRWRRSGRDPRGRGVIVAQYAPPKGFDAITSEGILFETVRSKALSAGILELAVHGHVRIHELVTEKKGSKPDYSLELLTAPGGLHPVQIKLIHAFFGNGATKGKTVELKSLKNKLYKDLASIQKSTLEELFTKGYFVTNPAKAISSTLTIGFIMLPIGFILAFTGLLTPVGIGILLSSLIVFIASRTMPARTPKGVETREHLLGLKEYIGLAEKERIQMLQSPEGARQFGDPTKHGGKVKLFESLLPYAILFGQEKKWAEQFKDLYTQPPEWYSGNTSAFHAGYLVSSMNNFSAATNATFSPPASSGSSGYSGGGGFSGGGGGGGGGGGW
jgi:uncharacterized membrane protein YgcG